jgi:hypothetical protein
VSYLYNFLLEIKLGKASRSLVRKGLFSASPDPSQVSHGIQ